MLVTIFHHQTLSSDLININAKWLPLKFAGIMSESSPPLCILKMYLSRAYICCSLFSQINQWWINPSVPFAINPFPKTKKILPTPKKVGLNRFMCLSTDPISDVEFFIWVDLQFRSNMVHPVSKSSVFRNRGNQIKITHIFWNVMT